MRSLIVGLALVTTVATATRHGQATAPKGVIAGTVVSAESGQPVRWARVRLTGVGKPNEWIHDADENGRFAFADLPPGRYSLWAEKAGYLTSAFGQRHPGSGTGVPIDLTAAQHRDALSIAMSRGAVITGAVLDEHGEPAYGVDVSAFRRVMLAGESSLQLAGTSKTDDRGIYRIPLLPSTEYVVMAQPPRRAGSSGAEALRTRAAATIAAADAGVGWDPMGRVSGERLLARADSLDNNSGGSMPVYAPVFYPGGGAALAQPLRVQPGEERSGVNLVLTFSPTAAVSGTVTGLTGPPSGLMRPIVLLLDKAGVALGLGTAIRSTLVADDGEFLFADVPPGDYTLVVDATQTGAQKVEPSAAGKTVAILGTNQRWAMADVSVTGTDVSGVSLAVRDGIQVTGRVVADESLPPKNLAIKLEPVGLTRAISGKRLNLDAALTEDGTFKFLGVVPGTYVVTIPGLGAPWLARSAMFNGRDALDVLLEVPVDARGPVEGVITLAIGPAALDGAIEDATGQLVSDCTVVLFPGDSRYWLPHARRIRAVQPSSAGAFSIADLPAGDYLLAALRDADPDAWFDPAFLKTLMAGSVPVVLREGQRTAQNLRIR